MNNKNVAGNFLDEFKQLCDKYHLTAESDYDGWFFHNNAKTVNDEIYLTGDDLAKFIYYLQED